MEITGNNVFVTTVNEVQTSINVEGVTIPAGAYKLTLYIVNNTGYTNSSWRINYNPDHVSLYCKSQNEPAYTKGAAATGLRFQVNCNNNAESSVLGGTIGIGCMGTSQNSASAEIISVYFVPQIIFLQLQTLRSLLI